MKKSASRREFLKDSVGGLCALGGAAVLGAGLTRLAFAEGPAGDVLVVLFLRGASDGLSLLPPLAGPDRAAYEAARPNLKIPTAGPKAALKLDDFYGLHPAAAPLHDLYQAGRLAFVHAAGLTADTRSHFDAQAFMELGTPGVKTTVNGWIARHLLTLGGPAASPSFLTAVSLGTLTPSSLLGFPDVAVLNSLDGFNLAAPKGWQNAQREALRRMYAGKSWLDRYGAETLDAIDAFESVSPGAYKPAGRDYPKGEIGYRLRSLAQLIKMDLGLRVAALDMGGWDTHKYQGDNGEGYFANLAGQLAQSLAAFHEDMNAGAPRRVLVAVMTEFGRRLKENASRGTDHGHGGVMMLLGDGVAGGKVYGQWPGLGNEQLFQRADLAVTTDYRRALAEVLSKRLANPRVAEVFPGLTDSSPLGLIRG